MKAEKQQTAVEWLVEQLFELRNPTLNQIEIIQQAKEMERQQIEKAYNSAVPFKYGKEYYEKTYKH